MEVDCDEKGYFSKMIDGDGEVNIANNNKVSVNVEKANVMVGEGGCKSGSVAETLGSKDETGGVECVLDGVEGKTEERNDCGDENKNKNDLGNDKMQEMAGRERG